MLYDKFEMLSMRSLVDKMEGNIYNVMGLVGVLMGNCLGVNCRVLIFLYGVGMGWEDILDF
jgi:hypothetical protein